MIKKLLFLAFLFFISINLFSQTVGRRFTTGKVFTTQVASGLNTFDISCDITDEGGYFDGTSVAVGDVLFVSDGGFGYYLPIVNVLSASPSTVLIRVNSTGIPLGAIPNDLGFITKGTNTFKFYPYVSGLSNANQQISNEEFLNRLDSILRFKLIDRISGSLPPAYTPAANQSWLAQNGIGDLYKFNGTTWLLDAGGVAITEAPLIGIGTALDPIGLDSFSINDAYITQNSIDSTELSQSGISLLNLARNNANLNQTIRWNGTRWVPNDITVNSIVPLSGTGQTGNPLLLLTNSLDSTFIKTGGISRTDIGQNGALVGQVLKWNGTTWFPSNDDAGASASIDSVRITSNNTGLTVKVNNISSNTLKLALGSIAQGGANNNQVLRWNGTTWNPSPENIATSVAEPTNQIVYGTGSGVDSDDRFKWNPSPAGSGIEVKARQTSTINNPSANEVWTIYDPNPLAGNIPTDKKFGRWYEYTLYDPDLNLLGDPSDTVGDMVHIRGYNLGLGDNPKRASAWWQSEQDYNLPTTGLFTKSSIEEHFNVRDTLGRLQRPINMAFSYDGSLGGVSFQGNYTSWFKANSQNLEYVWNFDANKFTIFDTTEIAIANSASGRFLSKQEVGGLNPLNVITQKSDNSFIIGDAKGIEVQDTLRLMFAGTQNGGTFTSLGVGTIQLGAAFKIKTTNDRMLSFEKVGIVSPADWQIRVDQNDIWWFGRNASTPLISVYKDATADLFTLRQGKVSIGQGYSIPSRFSVFQATDDQNGALAIINTARTRQWRQFIEGGVLKIRAASTNNTIPVVAFENTTTGNQLFVSNATPESNITGNRGDLTLANVSGTGKLFGKKTGTGNTGWEEFISTPNITNLLTVGSGTDSTSIIQTNVSGANPITLKASKDLRISESGSTITLSSNPDVLEFNGFDFTEFDCFPPSITPDPLHGPFFAKDTSNECGPAYYQWNHATSQWVIWAPFTGSLNVTPGNRLLFSNTFGNVTSANNAYYTGSGSFYFNVPDSRRTSGRAPYTREGALVAYHLNGTQHTEMRIASYGAGFDLHVEDHNQNESYSTYSTTYRSSATPGSYRAPVVGDLMFRELVRITRGNLPADPYDDACGFYPWDIKVASVGASNNVGTNVNFYTRKSTDPQSISGTGNLVLQLKENQDIRAVNYQLRNDAGTPTYVAGFNADGTFRSDLLSELAITETLGIDTDLGAPDGGLLTWDQTSGEWTGTQLAYHFEEVNYSATVGATTFTIPIIPATPTGSKMPIRVYRNGVKLIYTSGTPNVHQFSYSGTTLSTSACSAGDIISIEYLNY